MKKMFLFFFIYISDVKFSMPLNKTSNKTDLEKRWSPDTGYGSLEQDENNSNRAGSSDPIDSDFDDEEDNEAWLEECGLGRRQIQEFNTKQVRINNIYLFFISKFNFFLSIYSIYINCQSGRYNIVGGSIRAREKLIKNIII